MPNIHIVNSQRHGSSKVNANHELFLKEHQQTVVVFPVEYQFLAEDYPIFFMKNPETGQFLTVVMTGLDENENLYVVDGAWQANYIPLNLARQPFCYGKTDNGEELLCIDEDSVRFGEVGLSLFEEEKPTEVLERAASILAEIKKGAQEQQSFCETMAKYEMIEPAELKVSIGDEEKTLAGIYMLKRDNLLIEDEQLYNELKEKKFDTYIEAILASENRLGHWIDRKKKKDGVD